MSEKESRQKKYGWLIVLGVCLVIILLVFLFLNNGGEKYSKGNDDNKKVEAIVCTSLVDSNPVFNFSHAKKTENKIKVFFGNERLCQISYNYTGEYDSDTAADTAEAVIMAGYNNYMGENNKSMMLLVPTYSSIEKTVTVDLVAKRDDLDAITAKFFYLDSIEYNNIKGYSISKVIDLYKKKDFICERQ